MTGPLDLTSVGSKKTTPPPKKAPARKPIGDRSSKKVVVVVVLAIALVVIAGLVFFGGEDEKPTREVADTARFCGLAGDFDRLAPRSASNSDEANSLAGAAGRVLDQMGATLGELKDVTPVAVRADVAEMITALQEAVAGKSTALRSASYRTRRQRFNTFVQQMCSAGEGTPGD